MTEDLIGFGPLNLLKGPNGIPLHTQKSELCELLNQINVLIFNLINISVFGFKI